MSTRKRASRPSMSKRIQTDAKPALVQLYEAAIRQWFKKIIRVNPTQYNKFLSRMKDLDKMGASYDRYAQMVVKTWRAYCLKKKIPYVTVNMFTGPKALSRFRAQLGSGVVLNTHGEEKWSELVNRELEYATYYIGNHLNDDVAMSEADARKRISRSRPHKQVIEEVVGLLCDRFACKADNYDGVIEAVRETRSQR